MYIGIDNIKTLELHRSEGRNIDACEGYLALINVGYNGVSKESAIANHKPILINSVTQIKPVIFSKTERFEKGDWVYDRAGQWGSYIKKFDALSSDGGNCSDHCVKILALPEHFSRQQLKMIADGIFKHNDKVWIECVNNTYIHEGTGKYWEDEPTEMKKILGRPDRYISLNKDSHITFYPVEEKMVPISMLQKAFRAGEMHCATKGKIYKRHPSFTEWLEQQNIK